MMFWLFNGNFLRWYFTAEIEKSGLCKNRINKRDIILVQHVVAYSY